MEEELVKRHFNRLAGKYDYFKAKNLFNYYGSLKAYLKRNIPSGKRILDFGCGTGEILAFLSPGIGVGYDLSPKMIETAKRKFAKEENLRFTDSLTQISGTFDYVLMIDVIEHLAQPQKAFKILSRFAGSQTKIIVSFVDPSWKPVIWILEKLQLKMPEGPNKRISKKEVIELAALSGLKLVASPFFFSPVTFLTFKKK